jgi:hypothetical protein
MRSGVGALLAIALALLVVFRPHGKDAAAPAAAPAAAQPGPPQEKPKTESPAPAPSPPPADDDGPPGPTDPPPGFDAKPLTSGKASQFGKNDTQDEGTGSPIMGLIQTNSEVFGASVKASIMKKIFGAGWKTNEKRLTALIEVFHPSTKRMVRVPLVDIGPGETIRAEVDLTWACDQFLKTEGAANVQYRLLVPV